jgi:hypothetical protein
VTKLRTAASESAAFLSRGVRFGAKAKSEMLSNKSSAIVRFCGQLKNYQ